MPTPAVARVIVAAFAESCAFPSLGWSILGAKRSGVIEAVLRRGVMLAGAGVLGGLALSLSSARILESFLFDITPHDALTYVVVSGAFVAITLLASYLPARRASRVDPMVALRGE